MEIMARGTGEDEENIPQVVPNVIEGIAQLLEEMVFRLAPKRSQFSIPFSLANGLNIGIKGYGLVVEQKKSYPKRFLDVDGELKELDSKTSYIVEVRGSLFYGSQSNTHSRGGLMIKLEDQSCMECLWAPQVLQRAATLLIMP
jgi:ATP-dependent DNA helicase 2 subunit 1